MIRLCVINLPLILYLGLIFIIYKLGNPFLATGGFDTAQMRFGPQWNGLVGAGKFQSPWDHVPAHWIAWEVRTLRESALSAADSCFSMVFRKAVLQELFNLKEYSLDIFSKQHRLVVLKPFLESHVEQAARQVPLGFVSK